MRLHTLTPWAAAPCLAALLTTACAGEPADATADVDQPFATLLSGDPIHEQVTLDGLYFLKPEIALQLVAGNLATDVFFFLDNRYHFDDCNFSRASRLIAADQEQAVGFLNPSADTPETTFSALQAFARSLHAVQDLYSHTNWVEIEAAGLVDESLGAWSVLTPYSVLTPSNVMIVEGQPPRGTRVSRDARLPYPENMRVTVQRGAERWLGLVSGSVDYEPGDYCPARIRSTHEELNKDRSTDTDRTLQHEQAKALAMTQTTHEWCRLRALTKARWGEAGEQRLNTWVAAGATPPDCGAP